MNVDTIKSREGGPPTLSKGVVVSAAATFSTDVTIAGVLTYEDVTNVDSIGIITARSGIKFGAAGIGGTIRANGDTTLAGVVTATKFVGDGSGLTGLGNTDFINATQLNVIGVTTSTKLQVNESGAFNDADEYLLVKNTGAACNISVVGGTSNHSSVNLGDTDDFNIQKIRSGHSDNSLAFFTDNASRLHLDNSGRIGINTTTFDDAREALRIPVSYTHLTLPTIYSV